ncbi:hypothetical protein CBS101457_006075 [Exobasidium rhododendri]|nr:hypothetical protein CBS101457_006075 [Exobasidium rhododendri]
MRTPPHTRTSASRYSPKNGDHRTSSRSRAPIPFELGPRRTASSSSSLSSQSHHKSNSSSSSIIVTRLVEEGEEDDEVFSMKSAFDTLAKFKEKSDVVQDTVRPPRTMSSSSKRRLPEEPLHRLPSSDDLPAVGWLAWGSSRIKSTLPRNMASILFYSEDSKQDSFYDVNGLDILSSPAASPSTSSTKAHERSIHADEDEIQRYADRMVGFAGVDEESRAIVTLSAPDLPPSDQVSHDAILQRILAKLLPVVDSPRGYTLILFASGADLIDSDQDSKTIWPGWAWCWKAWRSLGRSYRKNLKKLYIVHPTRFTRTLVRLISTGSYFISPKFAKKIVQFESLKALSRQIPLTQLDIPPEVLIWDLKIGAKEDDFALQVESADNRLPFIVRDCVEALKGDHNEGGRHSLLQVEGMFRVSPSNALLRSAKYAYRLNRRPNLASFVEKDVHLPAALLKNYLRSLALPLFPAPVYSIIERCPRETGEEMLQYIRQSILPTLEEGRLILLSYVLQCFHEVSLRSEKNRMDAANLAVVLTPNLIRSDDIVGDVMMCRVQDSTTTTTEGGSLEESKTSLGTVIAFCIERYYEVFDEMDYDLPMLDFHEGKDHLFQNEDHLATLTTSKKAAIFGSRQAPTSPPSKQVGVLSDTFAPVSPSTKTPTTTRSVSSLRIKNRLLSGGSFRSGGLSTIEKADQSVAVVSTSAKGEFEMGGGGGSSKATPTTPMISSSSTPTTDDLRENDGDTFDLPPSPTIRVGKTGKFLGVNSPRQDRRPLSEVFEE